MNSRVPGKGYVFFCPELSLKFSVICRAFRSYIPCMISRTWILSNWQTFWRRKWVVQIIMLYMYLLQTFRFYTLSSCVLISRFLFKSSAICKIDEICETTAAEEFKSLFHLTCWLSAPGASLDSQAIRGKKRERTVRKREVNINPFFFTLTLTLTLCTNH